MFILNFSRFNLFKYLVDGGRDAHLQETLTYVVRTYATRQIKKNVSRPWIQVLQSKYFK